MDTDILISGGGLAGLSMAIACADAGLHATVIERDCLSNQHLPEFDGRVSAIAYGSMRMFERLGVWQNILPFAEPILDIRVSDNHSPFFLHYDHREVGTAPFGWIIENRHTRRALADAALASANITVIEGQEIAAFEAGDAFAQITLKDGRHIQSKLAVAAEGKHSKLRTLAGIHAHQTSYRQTAIVCTIQHQLPHHGLAQERFLPRGPFAVLPMQGNYSSLVWVEPQRLAKSYTTLAATELAQEIRERVGDYLGEISVVGTCFAYPLGLSIANRFTAPRVALIGDAAHAVHPIAGQGINLGFRDVAVLHHLMSEQKHRGLDIGDAATLAAYARWRRSDVTGMAFVTDGLTRLFSNDSRVLQTLRGLGLYSVSYLPPLKKFFMRHAMGTTGDLPQLMQ